MKKKIISFGIISLFLLSSITITSATNIRNDPNDPVISSMGEDVTLQISLLKIIMKDYIDQGIMGSNNKYADFYFKIWVYGGKDNSGDNFWRYDMPDDIQQCNNIDAKHTWNIGQREEVKIKIEVWDRDDPLGWTDDLCDINGAKWGTDAAQRYVVFYYNRITNQANLDGTGGWIACDKACFDGTDDGSNGNQHPDDDDDVYLEIYVSDDYKRPPKIRMYNIEKDFGKVTVGDTKKQTVAWFSNDGELDATGNVSLVGGNVDEFEIYINEGSFIIEPGCGFGVAIKCSPKTTGSKQVTLFVDGDYPCEDFTLQVTAQSVPKSRTKNIPLILQSILERFNSFPLFERLFKF